MGEAIAQVLSIALAVALLALVLGFALYPFVMLVDVLLQPRARWRTLGRSKIGWALIVLFGSFFGALAYALTVRRELVDVASTATPSRFPPPPPPPPPTRQRRS